MFWRTIIFAGSLLKKIYGIDAQCDGQFFYIVQRDVPHPPFNLTDIRSMEARQFSKVFLRNALRIT